MRKTFDTVVELLVTFRNVYMSFTTDSGLLINFCLCLPPAPSRTVLSSFLHAWFYGRKAHATWALAIPSRQHAANAVLNCTCNESARRLRPQPAVRVVHVSTTDAQSLRRGKSEPVRTY